jgi:hypothetical protein
MRHLLVSYLFVAAVLTSICCRGDEPEKSLADFVAPYVDAQTVAVVHIDLAAFRVADAINALADFLHLSEDRRDRLHGLVVPINVFADTLPPGARADVFLVFSISDLAKVPLFVVVPQEANPASGAIATELRRALGQRFGDQVALEQIGDCLITGGTSTIERLKKAEPKPREEIAVAFEAAGPSAVQLLLVPSADARRAIPLLYPTLPESLGGGPTSRLTGAVEWMAVGIGLPAGHTTVRIVVQATGEEQAAELAKGVSNLIEPLAHRSGIEESVPDSEELAKRLLPTAAGSRLSLDLRIAGDEMAQLGTLLSPLVETAGGIVSRQPPGKAADSE